MYCKYFFKNFFKINCNNLIGTFCIVNVISDYFLYKAKEDLKKLYIRHSGKNIKGYEPFRNMESKLKDRIGDIIDKNYTKESKINIITNDLMDFVTDEIQMLFIKLNDTFSLALKLMSNSEAVAFTNLYKQQNEGKYIYAKLKYKRCAVCNGTPVDFEHWQSAGSLGGYANDRGQGRYISLCRQHHTEKHDIGVEAFERKYDVRGIYLDCEQIKELKKIYKNHFKAFKEEI